MESESVLVHCPLSLLASSGTFEAHSVTWLRLLPFFPRLWFGLWTTHPASGELLGFVSLTLKKAGFPDSRVLMVCRARILNLANINSCNLSEFENFLEWDRDQHFAWLNLFTSMMLLTRSGLNI